MDTDCPGRSRENIIKFILKLIICHRLKLDFQKGNDNYAGQKKYFDTKGKSVKAATG
jgi:hypothetical protein